MSAAAPQPAGWHDCRDTFSKTVEALAEADPRIVTTARRMNKLSFDEMLEMTATGCPKPAMRSVEFARTHHVPLHIRSAFTWEPGTWVTEEDPTMEQAIITAVTHDLSEAKVTVNAVPDSPGIAAKLFRALADHSVNVDMIVQDVSHDGTTDIGTQLDIKSVRGAGYMMLQDRSAR